MGLENYESISSKENLVDELKSAIEGFQVEEGKAANDIIKSLNETQLTSFIEKSFKNENNKRLTYSQMRQNKFYPFMVQSAIDLLSDKKGDKLYDEDGNETTDKTKGKSLDGWIADCGGIDNKYGQGTRKVVEIVQNILKLEPADGLAGPQFFAKVCSELTGKELDVFEVEGYNNSDKKYKYNLDKEVEKGKKAKEENEKEKNEEEEVKKIIEYIKKTNSNKDIFAIKCDGQRTYFGIKKGSGRSDYDERYSCSTPYNNNFDLESSRTWGKSNVKPSKYDNVKNAMGVGDSFLDIRYNQVLAIKEKWISEYHGKWPPKSEDDVFKTWTDQCIKQKEKWNRHNKKEVAKWSIKKKDGCMGQDFLERGKKMIEKGLPADKITINTRLALRDIEDKNITKFVLG